MIELEPRWLERPVKNFTPTPGAVVDNDSMMGMLPIKERVLQTRTVYGRDSEGNAVTATDWQDVPVAKE